MPSPDDRQDIDTLLAELDDWKQGSRDSLVRLAKVLGADPEAVAERPYTMLSPVHELMRDEDVAALPEDDYWWLFTHVLAYTAQYVMHEYGGDWTVDTDPASPSYGRYVLSDFPPPAGGDFRLDVGEYVDSLFSLPVGRSYVDMLARVAEAVPSDQP
ncbi:hypothetical protein LO771_13460 [Streptacidiphilus sp. ASG 303]|uniref:hypothetical protein n=1 Tax=Streptacidiphilus sp. ASG 303 TaxID=2896847 RepID=UPI001E2EFA12|nr:hypothetical protein [Streptacidiphilus sp. ASG 303]MCD0483382.1 hypothetical protein [Streptacidiphilus sp. ASG 303]